MGSRRTFCCPAHSPRRSAARLVVAAGRDRGHDLGGAAVGVIDHRREVLLEAAVEMPLVAMAGDQAVVGKAGKRVRDGRPLGADQLAEELVGERETCPILILIGNDRAVYTEPEDEQLIDVLKRFVEQ